MAILSEDPPFQTPLAPLLVRLVGARTSEAFQDCAIEAVLSLCTTSKFDRAGVVVMSALTRVNDTCPASI
ncbi:hypothetical protein B0H19DRAFT_1182201 [Mycena capillaripes]|nr:hypothetical protein B0H19DRAFT_1182201 [Mycena capillaripes]